MKRYTTGRLGNCRRHAAGSLPAAQRQRSCPGLTAAHLLYRVALQHQHLSVPPADLTCPAHSLCSLAQGHLSTGHSSTDRTCPYRGLLRSPKLRGPQLRRPQLRGSQLKGIPLEWAPVKQQSIPKAPCLGSAMLLALTFVLSCIASAHLPTGDCQ